MASHPTQPTPSDFIPHFPGDRPSVPAAVELDSTTAWAEFERLQGQPSRPPDTSFAATEPDTLTRQLQSAAAPATPVKSRLTAQDVMVEARRFNRVCPQPEPWQQLHELLRPDPQSGRRGPPAPVAGPAWQATSSMPKRMCLRSQIDWAEENGALQQVMDFLKSLPEEQWHHMDE